MVDGDYTQYLSTLTQGRFHVAGLSSGIDTNSIIDELMQKAAEPLQRLTEKQEQLTNRQTALGYVSDRLAEFRAFLNDWKLESNFIQSNATSSNETIVQVEATGSAQDRSFDVKVDQVATNQTYYSSAFVSGSTSSKLSNLGGYENGVSVSGNLTITVDGTTYDPIYYYEGNTLQEILANIEALDDKLQIDTVSSSEGIKVFIGGSDSSVEVSIQDNMDDPLGINFLQALKMTDTASSTETITGATSTNTLANLFGTGDGLSGDGTLTINGISVDYYTTDTLADVINRINADPDLEDEVYAYTLENDDGDIQFSIAAKQTDTTITLSDSVASGSRSFLQMMNLTEAYYSTAEVTGASTDFLTDTGTLTISVGGTDYTVNYDVTDTLDDIIQQINTLDPDLKDLVYASVENGTGTMEFHLEAKDPSSDLSLSDTGTLLDFLNIDTSETSGHREAVEVVEGGYQAAQQAVATVTIDGIETEITSDTNTFSNVLEGVSLTVRRAQEASDDPIQIDIMQDLEGTYEHIEEFVSEYNDMMDYLYTRLYEDDEEDTTTDEDENPLADVLINDPLLKTLFEELRGMVYRDLDGAGGEMYYSALLDGSSTDTLADFGIDGSGTLTISVEGESTPYTLAYAETDTLEQVMAQLNGLNRYLNVYATASGDKLTFYAKSPVDIHITDSATGDTGFRDIFLTSHTGTALPYDFLSEIGIGSTDGFEEGYRNIMRGKIMINSSRLQAALADNVEDVWKTFGLSEETGDEEIQGFAVQLSDKLYEYTKYNSGTIDQVAGLNGSIVRELRYVNMQILNWSERLENQYEALWAKFTNMESVVSNLQAQGSALSQAIANLSGGSSSS